MEESAVQGSPPVLPARKCELLTAETIAGDELVLPEVKGGVEHLPGEGGQGAVASPRVQGGPQLSRGGGSGFGSGSVASDYSKS